MKAVLLVAAWTLVDFAVMTIVLRSRDVRRRTAALTAIWLISVPGFIVTHWVVPSNVWVLPSSLTEPWPPADLGFGLIVYAAAFFGGILQLYNLADRGFSLRILIDIREAGHPLVVEQIAAIYAGGQGIGWMFNKRVDDLMTQGLVHRDGGRLTMTPGGHRAARVLCRLQSMLRVA